MQADKWLIKAYQENGEINQAIALCQKLLINEDEATRKWARRLLFTDLFTDNIDVSTTAPIYSLPEEPKPAIEKFTPKTLKEFKVFCQKNLLGELKVFESRRKQALLSIITLHLLFLSGLIITLKLLSMISKDIIDYIYIEKPSLFENNSTPILVIFICVVITFIANIHALNHAKKQIIKLEDPEFAKFFNVYGDNQIEARYVLSTNLMDKIVNFRKKTNRNIYISFVDDTIYIAIEEARENNIFDPNLYKSVLSFAPLRKYFETLNLMLGIVEDLNLDRRI